MASQTTATTDRPKPPHRSWSATNSRQVLKNYDKSPLNSPPKTPPTLSRNSSTTSINSTQSEPAWQPQRHASEPDLREGDFNQLKAARKTSHPTQATNSTPEQTAAAHKKHSGIKGIFSRHEDPAEKEEKEKKRKEKERKKWEKYKAEERLQADVKFAATLRVKMLTDPNYQEFQKRHKTPTVKTAARDQYQKAAHSKAAADEARFPHSGPPAIHADVSSPLLTRIESRDDPDDQLDPVEARNREWNQEHGMVDIPEIRSRQASPRASPWASPIASREPSPNRSGGASARPGLGSKRNSWAGAYHRDANGRWTKKTPPNGRTPPGGMTPVYPNNGSLNPDTLAASLAERLNMTR